MLNMKFWDGNSQILLGDGTPFTKEQIHERWPFSKTTPVILTMNGPLTVGFDCLYILADIFKINPDLPEDAQLEAIKTAMERAQDPNYDSINEILDMLESEDD